jgi:hypothetical protein
MRPINKLLTLLLIFPIFIYAQTGLKYYLPSDITYDSKILTPKEFLGYEVGEQHVSPYELLAYYKEIAKQSDRIKISTYGQTFEKRELMLATVSHPENLLKLSQLQSEHLKLADPNLSKSIDLKKMPIVVWMGYSVHGNEASGLNSALLSIYHLAAAQGPKIDSILKECIILIDPVINPDGANRFATWVNQNKSNSLVSDPDSREFKETWPGGRTNHYWFDMNRDWLYQQLPESKGRMVKYYEWLPNVLTDHHEMGSASTFFFQPGIPARTHPLTPKKNIELTGKIGEFHAKGLDKIGSFYYTKENYDDFYYGKGSTLPDVNGAIGILFEQASSRGHLQETIHGKLSFPFTIRNQFSATMSTLQASKDMKVELLSHMRDFFSEKPIDEIKSYVFGGGNDPVRTWEMINVLKRNQIEVHSLAKSEKINGLDFDKENAFLVQTNQPKHRLIKSLFERRTTFQDSAFYDISAWTLPLCMNVPFVESKIAINAGKLIETASFPEGKVVGESKYAYLFEWDGYFAPRTAYELLSEGYKLKYAMEPFKALVDGQSKTFDYGTVQIECGDKNPKALLENLAKRDAISFYAQNTGLTLEGINLGSEKFKVMDKPSVLMIVGEGVDANDAGEVWHLLDQRVNVPLSHAEISVVNRLDLSKYSHIIINQGRYNGLSEEKIKTYLQAGGIVVALGEGAAWLSEKKLGTIGIKPEANNNGKNKRPFVEKSAWDGAMVTSGAILDTKIDVSHPLCFGYKQSNLPIFKVNNVVFEETGNPYNTPIIFTGNPLLAGYVHTKNLEKIKNSPAVIAQAYGQGKIISISDNPNFRAFWYGTNKLFLNAIFFGKSIAGGRFGEEEE